MIHPEAYLPRYVQIKAFLLEAISKMQPGEKILSEAELAAKFSVSRGTVKQAIMELVYAGQLYRMQGKGTFIPPSKVERSFDQLPTITNDLKKVGRHASHRTLAFSETQPSQRLIDLFSLQEGAVVVRFKRLTYLDSLPFAFVSSYLNPHLFPGLTLADIGNSLYSSLQEKYGFAPTKAKDTYSIVHALPKTATLLGCDDNTAIFYSERVAYVQDGTPAEYVESFIRGDRFKLEVKVGNFGAPI